MKTKLTILTLSALLSISAKAQWTSNFPTNVGGRTNALATSGTNVYAGGTYTNSSNYDVEVYRSGNNGASWMADTTGLPIHFSWGEVSAFAISSSTIFAGTQVTGVYLSTNNGASWSADTIGWPAYVTVNALAISGNNIFAGTYGRGVYLSTNNATGWSAVNAGLPSNADINAIAVSGNNIFAGLQNNGIYLSTNNGTSWSAANTGLPAKAGINALTVSGSNIFVSAGDSTGLNNKVYLSTNNGFSWSAVNTGLPANGYVQAFVVSGSTIFAGTNNGVYLSNNNGTSWSAVNTGLPANVYVKALAVNSTTLFAGTNANGVWQRPLSQVTGINESIALANKELTLYPNPVTGGVLTIQGTEKVDAITLYNVLGQKMLEYKAGNTIDVSTLPKGLYTVILSNKDSGVVRKVVIQ